MAVKSLEEGCIWLLCLGCCTIAAYLELIIAYVDHN
jgi:hypothetical protein